MLAKLLSQMDGARFENHVTALMPGGGLWQEIEPMCASLTSLGLNSPVQAPKAVLALCRQIRKLQPDIVQTWLYHGDLAGGIAAKLSGVPAIWNIRCSNVNIRNYGLASRAVLAVLPYLSRLPVAAISNSTAGQISHEAIGYRPKRWVLIPNGFDTERFRPDRSAGVQVRQELGLAADAFVVGMVARYDPQKDHETFLRAAKLHAEDHPGSRFVLVGRGLAGESSPVRASINACGLQGKVLLLEERTDIPRILQAFDVFSLTSDSGEGFPNVVGEAMSCGVPCVVTDVGDAAKIVKETGRVVPPTQPTALANAWTELAQMDRSRLQELGEAARQRIVENFTLPDIVARFERLYEEAVGGTVPVSASNR